MKVAREEFLGTLEGLVPGLAGQRENIEQSKDFVFQGGFIYSYNDETACRGPSPLGDFTGAVHAQTLLDALRNSPDPDLTVSHTKERLVLRGKNGRQDRVRLDKEILLPVDNIQVPEEWTPLHQDFSEAVSLVQDCAGAKGDYTQTMVHVTPRWVEACSGVQFCRYKCKTKFKENVLLRKESIRHVVTLGMTGFAETDNWVYFKNPNDLVLSCRRYLEEFLDYSEFLTMDGVPLELPRGLEQVLDRCLPYLEEKEEDAKKVRVELSPGRLRIIGEGANGDHTEPKKVQYDGPPIAFLAGVVMLTEISKKHTHCQATESKLKVDGGKWKYVAILNRVPENEEPVQEEDEGEEDNGKSKPRSGRSIYRGTEREPAYQE